jgi:uncharacterized protein DUF3617
VHALHAGLATAMRSTTTKRAGIAIVLVLALGAATAWAQLALRPGKYDVKLEVTMAGLPLPMSQEDVDCLSPDDAMDLVKAMLRELATAQSCTASNIKQTGNKLTFDAACVVEGAQVTSSTELTLQSETAYTAVMTVKTSGLDTVMKITGKWAGEACTG